jgi:hypothetical protein
MNLYYVFGIILLIGGAGINYAVNRRRFYRRGVGGLQHFKTYSGAVVTSWFERLCKLIAIALIVFGIGMLLLGHDQKAQQKIWPKERQGGPHHGS